MDNEVACESTAEGLLLIAKNAPIWRRLTGILGYNQSVEDAVVDLYTQILGFLKPAICRFQKSPLGKSGHNCLTRIAQYFASRTNSCCVHGLTCVNSKVQTLNMAQRGGQGKVGSHKSNSCSCAS
jgi:hypothetical protein